MSTKKDTVNERRVGRPALEGHTRMLLRLGPGIAEEIDAVAGERRRAEFIREAIDRELKRRNRAKT